MLNHTVYLRRNFWKWLLCIA